MKPSVFLVPLALALTTATSARADDALREQGRKLLDAGEPAEAESVLERATKASPKDADAWFLLGRAHLATERFRDAAEAFESAFHLDTERQDALYNLAHAQRKAQAYAKAAESYRLFLQRNPADADAYYGLAETLVSLKDKTGAADAYDRYADNEKVADRRPWVEKARARANELREEAADEKARKLSKAKESGAKAPEAAPSPAPVAAAAPVPAAAPAKKTVADLEAMRPDAYKKGIALIRQSSFDAAVPLLDQAVKDRPTDAFVMAGLGAALLGAREFARAVDVYARALELAPENARAAIRFGLAEAKRQVGDEAAARALYANVASDASSKPELQKIAAERAQGK
ncbi:MAG: tetratricopeptide repeat protein [Myxococcota bacterium]